MIRAFVGIPLPDDVAGTLEAVQAGLPAGRPVPYDNFHVTVLFLGEHQEPVVEDLHDALDTIRGPGFSLRIEGLGMFGGKRPRVLFADVPPEPGLTQLRRKVARAAEQAGMALQRTRFRPHVTLARFGDGLRGEDAVEMQAFVGGRVGVRAGPFPVESFALYRSYLGRAGPIYDVLAEYPLDADPLSAPS